MITPKEYKSTVAKSEVTPQILGDVIYSYNKRAKNMRDKAREYRLFYNSHYYYQDNYGNEERCNDKKEMYYNKKDKLLKFSKPIAIHKVSRTRFRKVFDWMDDYDEDEGFNTEEGIFEFYDRRGDYHTYYYVDDSFDEYYLYYSIGNHTFHHPISIEQLKDYNLEVEDIGDLTTSGTDQKELLSVQFCNTVYTGLTNGTLSMVA